MFYLLLVLGVISRLVPHPANFVPIGAFLIFYASKRNINQAALLGLLIMIISDFYLGFSKISLFVYLGFIGYLLAGRIFKKKALVLAPFFGSLFFFIVSNFGVWLGGWYSRSLEGLANCFIAAIPFYKNTLAADLVFTAGIFFVYFVYGKITKERGYGPSTYRRGISAKSYRG